ncbi:MAG: muconolactone Delta-isomerase family protein [Bacteroidota bacterium]|jgi:muconolactone delta-isomerase
MKILALEKEVIGIADEQFTPNLLKEEARQAWKLHQEGIIRELYFRQDRNEAVLIFECKDVEEAQSVLATLPLVKAGLIAFEIIPLIPYNGFARLFSEEA